MMTGNSAPHDLPSDQGAEKAYGTRLQRVVECAPVGMHFYALVDDELVFTGGNPAADTILGTDNGKFVGRPIRAAFPGLAQTEVPDQYKRLARDGGEWRTDDVHYDEGGIVGAYEVVAFQTEPGAVTVIFTDVTEKEKAAEELRRYRGDLERLVEERSHQLDSVSAELDSVVAVIGRTVEIRDPYTAGHQRRVALLAGLIGIKMGLSDIDVERLTVAATLHDLGKIAVPADILTRPSRLSPAQYAIVQEHPTVAFEILDEVPFGWPLAQVVYQHHERYDGSGYPNGLSGEEMEVGARILAVADVAEAMSSHRPYRPALGTQAALDELAQGRGRLYCPECVDACLAAFAEGFEFD